MGLQQVTAGCQVAVRGRQVPDGRVCIVGGGVAYRSGGWLQAAGCAAQRERGVQGGPHLRVGRAGGGELIGQGKVIQVPGHRRY